jgi:hypothetical protein
MWFTTLHKAPGVVVYASCKFLVPNHESAADNAGHPQDIAGRLLWSYQRVCSFYNTCYGSSQFCIPLTGNCRTPTPIFIVFLVLIIGIHVVGSRASETRYLTSVVDQCALCGRDKNAPHKGSSLKKHQSFGGGVLAIRIVVIFFFIDTFGISSSMLLCCVSQLPPTLPGF